VAVKQTFGAGRTVIVVASPDADWNYTASLSEFSLGLRVHSIQFVPSNYMTNVAYVKDGSATGVVTFYAASPNQFATKYFHGKTLKPYIDATPLGNYTATVNAKFIFTLADD